MTRSRYAPQVDDACMGCFHEHVVPPTDVQPLSEEDGVEASYRCPECDYSWQRTWPGVPERQAVPALCRPALHMDRWIVLPAGGLGVDYNCDLTQADVEWWIDHVSRKTWWNPSWATSMRALAGSR